MKINPCIKCGSKMPGLWINEKTIDGVALYSVGCIVCNWQGGIFQDQDKAIENWNETKEETKETKHTVCEGCDDFMGECNGGWSCPGAF